MITLSYFTKIYKYETQTKNYIFEHSEHKLQGLFTGYNLMNWHPQRAFKIWNRHSGYHRGLWRKNLRTTLVQLVNGQNQVHIQPVACSLVKTWVFPKFYANHLYISLRFFNHLHITYIH